jgi:hypothetical protein
MPPYQVLHTDIMENDPTKIKGAVEAVDKPFVVVFSRDYKDQSSTKKIMMETGLWYL